MTYHLMSIVAILYAAELYRWRGSSTLENEILRGVWGLGWGLLVWALGAHWLFAFASGCGAYIAQHISWGHYYTFNHIPAPSRPNQNDWLAPVLNRIPAFKENPFLHSYHTGFWRDYMAMQIIGVWMSAWLFLPLCAVVPFVICAIAFPAYYALAWKVEPAGGIPLAERAIAAAWAGSLIGLLFPELGWLG